MNLPRSGWSTKITPRAQWRLIQEVIKEPRTTSKELQASLTSIKVSVHDSTIRKRLGKNGTHERVPRQNPLLTKKNTKARLTFAKNKYLDYHQDFWANILWIDETILNFLEGACPITSGVKPTQHFIERTSYQQSNMVVVVWWSGVAFWGSFTTWTNCHNWWDHEFCSLSENPEGECPAVSLWHQAHAHMGYAAGQWYETQQQVHFWMAQEKQN